MIKSYLKIFAGDVLGSLNSAIVALPQALAFGVATGFGASAGFSRSLFHNLKPSQRFQALRTSL